MNSHWHHMMESLFNSKSWQQLDTEQLKRMTLEYPYFPITQFMYARKLKLDHHSAYPEQAAKTAIFFTNPYWLNWQMNLDKYTEDLFHDRIKIAQPVGEASPELDAAAAHIDHAVQEIESQPVEMPLAEEPIIDEEMTESFVDEFERNHPQDSSVDTTQHDLESVETAEIEPQPEIEIEPAEVVEISTEASTVEDKPEPVVATVAEPVIEQAAEPVQEVSKLETTNLTEESFIPIEPLFTTDYFASQGIKLSEAEETSDRLGQKLKSFTEWLKTMKRVQPKETIATAPDINDLKVQRIAETSNESREVLTETMAEVLLLQGLKDKAIEVYQKLSLLNPQKSAYFAAKIEEIKVV